MQSDFKRGSRKKIRTVGVIDWLSNKVGRGSKPYFYEFYNLNLKSFLGGLDPLDPS